MQGSFTGVRVLSPTLGSPGVLNQEDEPSEHCIWL